MMISWPGATVVGLVLAAVVGALGLGYESVGATLVGLAAGILVPAPATRGRPSMPPREPS